MLELKGENLGKRQQELNYNVSKFIKEKRDFEEIEDSAEQSDINRLFKIDVASHYRNIDYIIETLKSGDSLFISRALKSAWLYEDEYSHIINPDFLHCNVFPHMSLKMKTKMINSIAYHIKNEKRAEDFYNYFDKIKMSNYAVKFLHLVSEYFKLYLINCNNLMDLIRNDETMFKRFIGSSFNLIEAFLTKLEVRSSQEYYLKQLSHLYSVDDVKYLDLLEKYSSTNGKIFGGRISKDIMTKHKDRVLWSPYLYIHKLTNYTLVHHSTSNDAKLYIKALKPKDSSEFCMSNFYKSYKYILDMIPKDEVFMFFKETFQPLFGKEPIEMCREFYDSQLYMLMTEEQRELWALKLIDEGNEILGSNKDYIWYRFVNFEQAFKAIRQYILVATDASERNDMVLTLVHSCKNQRELEKLFNYYYERFVNEIGYHKENFINCVKDNHDIFTFDKPCWDAFNKILFSMEVYTPGFYGKDKYRALCVIYSILHNLEMPEALTYYLDTNIQFYRFKFHFKGLDETQKENIYQFLFNYYLNHFQSIANCNDKEQKQKKIQYARKLLKLMQGHKKNEGDIPKNVVDFFKKNREEFYDINIIKTEKLSDQSLLRLLKKDKTAVISKLPLLKEDNCNIKLRCLIKKVKLYFSGDIDKEFLKFFQECIENNADNRDLTRTAIYGMFVLGNKEYKDKLLSKYAPKKAKIDHMNIDRKLLDIQAAICHFAFYSRPPVPLKNILQYIRGDYLHFCLPMFNYYLRNLPLPQSIEFINSIIDAPLSIQKHGIRMAFKAYETDNLKDLIENVSQKSKNISLRFVIYKSLVNKINESNENIQDQLFDSLTLLTGTLREDDTKELFEIIVSDKIPERFRSKILEITWLALNKLPSKKEKVTSVKASIVAWIERSIQLMDRKFCMEHIIKEHVDSLLTNEGLKENNSSELYEALWSLTARYITVCNNQNDVDDSLSLVTLICQEIFKQWTYISENNKRIYVKFCNDFFKRIKNKTFEDKDNDYIIPIFERILQLTQEFAPPHEVFQFVLDLKLVILSRKVRSEKILDIETVASSFNVSLVTILDDLMKNDQLFPSLFEVISNLISNSLSDTAALSDLNEYIFTAYVCRELIKSGVPYNIVLAMSILPSRCLGTVEEKELFQKLSEDFVNEVKCINNFEIQSYYFKKFVFDTL